MKDVLFFEESIQVIYHYVKDLPSRVVNFFPSWPQSMDGLLFTIFLHLWIRPVLDLSGWKNIFYTSQERPI